jgi:hypothetical protein
LAAFLCGLASKTYQKKDVVLRKFHRKPGPNKVLPVGWNDYLSNILKMILMKKTNFFYHLLIVLGLCGLMFCGEGGNNTGAQGNDSTGTSNDSTNAAHHVDPANAYPQPPVTGSDQDSSHVKDTANRPGY